MPQRNRVIANTNSATLLPSFGVTVAAVVTRRNHSRLPGAPPLHLGGYKQKSLRALRQFLGACILSMLAVADLGLGQNASLSEATAGTTAPPRIRVQSPVDDSLIQAELNRLGGLMAERGDLLPQAELLKRRSHLALTLPVPVSAQLDEAALAGKCKAAAVVVARLARLGTSNSWVAVPASGFFISTNGAFVTSSHVIHNPDYEGIVVLTGDGRVLPVRALLADDKTNDVAILEATGDTVSALALETMAEAGSRVAVMSHPVGRFFTFTQGSVTRRSLQPRGAHTQELLEITADFGPGSSGAPVVNLRGNVVGWADTLRVWPGDANRDPTRNPTLTFRECGVSGDILRLFEHREQGEN
jgi:S1-C subfamily serine protease